MRNPGVSHLHRKRRARTTQNLRTLEGCGAPYLQIDLVGFVQPLRFDGSAAERLVFLPESNLDSIPFPHSPHGLMNQGLSEVVSSPQPSPAHKLARRAMAAATGPEAKPAGRDDDGDLHMEGDANTGDVKVELIPPLPGGGTGAPGSGNEGGGAAAPAPFQPAPIPATTSVEDVLARTQRILEYQGRQIERAQHALRGRQLKSINWPGWLTNEERRSAFAEFASSIGVAWRDVREAATASDGGWRSATTILEFRNVPAATHTP